MARCAPLIMPDSEARATAAELTEPGGSDESWVLSDEGLLLLSVATESGRLRAERIRKETQRGRYAIGVGDMGEDSLSPQELAQRWERLVTTEDAAWETRRAELRRTLQASGKLPPA
jgi:hypothetical protein